MSLYMTEEEQLESIKKWWKRYGTLIIVVLSLILFFVAGYRYMHWHQDKLKQQASSAYEHMMSALSNQNLKEVKSYANELIHEHSSSVYADVAHMTLAKIYVSKNKLAKAEEQLRGVVQSSQILCFKQIAKIRLARILAAEKSYTNALQELSTVEDKAYAPIINELKADVYGVTGEYQEAMNFYKLALDEVKSNGMANLFLEMKRNEMAIKTQSLAPNQGKAQTKSSTFRGDGYQAITDEVLSS